MWASSRVETGVCDESSTRGSAVSRGTTSFAEGHRGAHRRAKLKPEVFLGSIEEALVSEKVEFPRFLFAFCGTSEALDLLGVGEVLKFSPVLFLSVGAGCRQNCHEGICCLLKGNVSFPGESVASSMLRAVSAGWPDGDEMLASAVARSSGIKHSTIAVAKPALSTVVRLCFDAFKKMLPCL
jgi:hypothetical protein